MTEKQGMINLSSYNGNSYVSLVFGDFKVPFHRKLNDAVFVGFSIVFFSYTALNNRKLSLNVLAFRQEVVRLFSAFFQFFLQNYVRFFHDKVGI